MLSLSLVLDVSVFIIMCCFIIQNKNEDEVKKTSDDYDLAVRSLQFEIKGQVNTCT